MDKIKLLQTRKNTLLQAGKAIRGDIDAIIDKGSFVELSSFSFSESEFYGDKAEGEGVVCGFATINDYPYYIVAQNAEVLNGGVSKANCEKIAKCLEQAEKNGSPVIYILSSLGVRVGEGVNVLEGLADLILKASRLKTSVSQYLVVDGDVYGQVALLAGMCDFTFFIDKKSVLALNSPLVISAASGQNLAKDKVGGAAALDKTGLTTFVVKDLAEVKSKLIALNHLLNIPVQDGGDLNASLSALNKKADAKALLSVFDKGAVEVGASYCTEIKCYLARIGGISVASVIFDNEGGVELCANKARKLKNFAALACDYNLPFVIFVNTLGVKSDLKVSNSPVIKELCEYVSILDCMGSAKISVVYGKAVGLGYTLFAAKSIGFDYTYAFANAQIALFDSVQGGEIELAGKNKGTDADKLAQKYVEENSDPINAAKGGYIDNIIEPAFVRQYIIASLQMLVK